MTRAKEANATWIYRALVGAMITVTLGFVVKNYYDFQDLKVHDVLHTEQIRADRKDISDLQSGLQRETGRINVIYESKVFRR
ncbi:MAG: hypothetical protein ACEQSL_07530 [Sediminibacterium sp.]